MSKQRIEGLLTRLHEKFADADTSPQQEAMLQQLRAELGGPTPPDGSVITTAEMLMLELKERHPHIAEALRELIEELGNIGI